MSAATHVHAVRHGGYAQFVPTVGRRACQALGEISEVRSHPLKPEYLSVLPSNHRFL